MNRNHLRVIQGGKDADELIAMLLRALRLADITGSATTHDLLKMALLNEGVQLANTMTEARMLEHMDW